MKKIIVLLIMFMSFTSVYSQNEVYKTKPIMDSLSYYVSIIEKYDTEVVFTQTDIISNKCSKSTFRNLYKNWTYNVLVFGDWRIKQIAIEIFKITKDGKNIFIKGCYDKKHFATVEFKPDEDEIYMIDVTVIKFISGFDTGRYGLMIFHEL